jgi:sugar (pentulose or hexulose) kinase
VPRERRDGVDRLPAAGCERSRHVTDLLVGIDVGTSACKAAVVDTDGRELAHGKAPTPWRQVPTGAEVDPDALVSAAVEAAGAAVASAPEGRVQGIGVTSMAEAGVLLDKEDHVLHPAIAWHDARGADEAERIAAELGAESFSERTGLPASPLCTLAKLRWLVGHHPPARAGRRWLNVGEWVVRRLGGRDVAELSLSSRTGLLDLAAKAPFGDALAWTGLPEDLLPELVLAGTPAGTADGAALPQARGATLTVAGHDHLCAGAGVGVVAPGDVLDYCGTAEALVRVVAPPLRHDEIRRSVTGGVTVGFHLFEGNQALLAGVWSGIALQEVLDRLGVDTAGRSKLAAGALAAVPDEVPALELELHSLERPPLRLPAGVAAERSCGPSRRSPARTGASSSQGAGHATRRCVHPRPVSGPWRPRLSSRPAPAVRPCSPVSRRASSRAWTTCRPSLRGATVRPHPAAQPASTRTCRECPGSP